MAYNITDAQNTTSGYTSNPVARMEALIDEYIQSAAYYGRNTIDFMMPPQTTATDWTTVQTNYKLAGYSVVDAPDGEGGTVPNTIRISWATQGVEIK